MSEEGSRESQSYYCGADFPRKDAEMKRAKHKSPRVGERSKRLFGIAIIMLITIAVLYLVGHLKR